MSQWEFITRVANDRTRVRQKKTDISFFLVGICKRKTKKPPLNAADLLSLSAGEEKETETSGHVAWGHPRCCLRLHFDLNPLLFHALGWMALWKMHSHCKFIHNIDHILIKLTGVDRPWKDLLVLERSEPPDSPKATTATCSLIVTLFCWHIWS